MAQEQLQTEPESAEPGRRGMRRPPEDALFLKGLKMTDRDLRRMNRRELLELLIALEQENEALKEQVRRQEEQLQSREIEISEFGSLAEAALALNQVFESADRAAAQYLENIKRRSEQQKSEYDRIIAEAEEKVQELLRGMELGSQKNQSEQDEAE